MGRRLRAGLGRDRAGTRTESGRSENWPRIYSMRPGRANDASSPGERIALDQPPADRAGALDQVGPRDHAPQILVLVLPGERLLPACPHPLEEAADALLGQVVAVLRARGGH